MYTDREKHSTLIGQTFCGAVALYIQMSAAGSHLPGHRAYPLIRRVPSPRIRCHLISPDVLFRSGFLSKFNLSPEPIPNPTPTHRLTPDDPDIFRATSAHSGSFPIMSQESARALGRSSVVPDHEMTLRYHLGTDLPTIVYSYNQDIDSWCKTVPDSARAGCRP